MKKYNSFKRSAVIAVSSVALTSGFASGAFVQIDFGPAGDEEPGFTEQATGAATPYGTPEGIITVASTGGFFDRSTGAGHPSPLLYGDFTFANNLATNAMTITIAGAGIVADTAYEIEFFSYDNQHGGGGGTVTYAGLSGTVGGTSIAYSSAFIDDNSSLSTFTSNGSGEIVIGVTGTNEGPRVNGLIINSVPVPEPSSIALLGLGGLALLLRRRK